MSPRRGVQLEADDHARGVRDELGGTGHGEVGEDDHGGRTGRDLADELGVDVPALARGGVPLGAGERVSVPLQEQAALVVDEADEPARRRMVLGVQPQPHHAFGRLAPAEHRHDGEVGPHAAHAQPVLRDAAAHRVGALVVACRPRWRCPWRAPARPRSAPRPFRCGSPREPDRAACRGRCRRRRRSPRTTGRQSTSNRRVRLARE